MTPTELNNALAEFEGYKWVKVADETGVLNSRALYGALSPDDTFLKEHCNPPMDWPILQVCYRPNYTGDLNVVHRVAHKLDSIDGSNYCMELRKIVMKENKSHMIDGRLSDLWFYEATALQRCIALAKTLGVWREP